MLHRIHNGEVLLPDGAFAPATLVLEDGMIAGVERPGTAAPATGEHIDARGLLVLPGMVDLHGDAFERQVMPRPRVHFPLEMALAETDRQLLANGITTAFHAVTLSWEPGLRSREACCDMMAALARLQRELHCDTRLHLRFETHNVDAADDVMTWMEEGRIGLLAFNDHTDDMLDDLAVDHKRAKYAERTGLSLEDFAALLERTRQRRPEVAPTLVRLAEAARTAGIATLSHDDRTAEERLALHELGCHIAEFPETRAAAQAARELGDAVVFGAPNIVRGGSHSGAVDAAAMVDAGLCTVLASDYYYPAQLTAAFCLADRGILPLGAAWQLVAANPAAAAGLSDRGLIAPGRRADLVLVDRDTGGRPRVRATIVAGRPVYRFLF